MGRLFPMHSCFSIGLWGKELPFIGFCGCFWTRVSDLTGAWDWMGAWDLMIVSERELCYPVYKR